MIKTVREIVDFYIRTKEMPIASEIDVQSNYFKEAKPQFISIIKDWKVLASSGSIKTSEKSAWEEATKNIKALFLDKRLTWFKEEDLVKVKIRFDEIIERKALADNEDISLINTKTSGVLIIKNDYSKIACVLPDISDKIKDEKSLKKVLEDKIGEKYQRKNFVVYEIITNKQIES